MKFMEVKVKQIPTKVRFKMKNGKTLVFGAIRTIVVKNKKR